MVELDKEEGHELQELSSGKLSAAFCLLRCWQTTVPTSTDERMMKTATPTVTIRKLVNLRRSTPEDLSTTILPSLLVARSFSSLKATLPSALPSATVPCSSTSSVSFSNLRSSNSRDLPR